MMSYALIAKKKKKKDDKAIVFMKTLPYDSYSNRDSAKFNFSLVNN